jgi:hypothetical protein
MRNLVVLGASALVLALSVAGASAQPTTDRLLDAGNGATFQSSTAWAMNPTIHEGRAAALVPDNGGFLSPGYKGR